MNVHEHVSPARVLVAAAVTVTAALLELAGAAEGGTLFLTADACHLLAHVGIFLVLLLPAGRAHDRREDVAATTILGVIALVATGIAGASIERLVGERSEPMAPSFMLLSLLGLAANLTTAWLFADPARTRWSFRAALAHELADGGITVGGLVGAGAIALFGWTWVDPGLSLGIAGWLGGWSVRLLVRRFRGGRSVWSLEDGG